MSVTGDHAPSVSESGGTPEQTGVFRVGVTGHRPNGLRRADLALLRARIRDCLEHICELVGGVDGDISRAPPTLAVVSPLAEGADRLVAEEALALGFVLLAPLPFTRDEYERDFRTAASRDEYHHLLDRADEVVELAGARAHANGAYARAGREVLERSDLLIAIWDGREARGDGGTGQVVLDAIHRHLPTIWIRAAPPHGTHLLLEDAERGFRVLPLDHLHDARHTKAARLHLRRGVK